MGYMLKSGRELGAIDPSTFVANYNVRRGSKNENVRTVQFLLNAHGAGLATDAIFGPLTEAAVKGFQRSNGLVIDGIVGPVTSRALQDDESRSIGQPPPSSGGKPPANQTPKSSKSGVVVVLLALAAAGGAVVVATRPKKGHKIARANPNGRKRKRLRRRR